MGSSVRIITESTNGANPATSYINVPIGNPGTGAGQIQMSILGRNIDKEGQVAVPKMTIPPIPVPSFGAVCFQQNGPGTGTVDCNGDAGEAAPDPLDYRTLQDHVTNNPDSQPAEEPQCQFGCREGSSCPGPFTPLPNQECGRCVPQPGVCAGGPLQGHACEFDTQCPGQPAVIDPITGRSRRRAPVTPRRRSGIRMGNRTRGPAAASAAARGTLVRSRQRLSRPTA